MSVLRYAIIKYEVKKYTVEFEFIKCETIHKIFAGPMGIIPKVRNTIKKNVRKYHVNSLARMKSACLLKESLMSFMYNIS